MCLCGHNSIPVVLLLHGTCCQISVTSCCLTQYVLFCPVNYFILPSISSSTLGSFTSVEKLSVHRCTRVLGIMTNVLSLISCSVHGPENLCFLLWCCSCIKVFNWLSCYPLTSAWYQPSFFLHTNLCLCLTNHHPSVLWHCLLGHVTRNIVSKMTYNMSSGTLNPTIRYHTILCLYICHAGTGNIRHACRCSSAVPLRPNPLFKKRDHIFDDKLK